MADPKNVAVEFDPHHYADKGVEMNPERSYGYGITSSVTLSEGMNYIPPFVFDQLKKNPNFQQGLDEGFIWIIETPEMEAKQPTVTPVKVAPSPPPIVQVTPVPVEASVLPDEDPEPEPVVKQATTVKAKVKE